MYVYGNANKLCCIHNKSVWYPRFKNIGLLTIGDVLSPNGTFLGFDILSEKGINPSEFFLWTGIVHSLPNEWRLLLKVLRVNSIPYPSRYILNRDLADASISLNGNSLVSSRGDGVTSAPLLEPILRSHFCSYFEFVF